MAVISPSAQEQQPHGAWQPWPHNGGSEQPTLAQLRAAGDSATPSERPSCDKSARPSRISEARASLRESTAVSPAVPEPARHPSAPRAAHMTKVDTNGCAPRSEEHTS